MERQPSIFKIITVDYVALSTVLFPVVIWSIYLALLVLKNIQVTDHNYPAVASVITIASLLVLIWRIRMFFAIFNDGLETSAIISNVSFFRDRGRIDYVFTHQGQKYTSGNMIHKVRQTEALKVGDEVIVMVERNNPKRAYIRDLYT
jgi:hypothetical protein